MHGMLRLRYHFQSFCRCSDKYLGRGTWREILHGTEAASSHGARSFIPVAAARGCCQRPHTPPLSTSPLHTGHPLQRIPTALFSNLWKPAWNTKKKETTPFLLPLFHYRQLPSPMFHGLTLHCGQFALVKVTKASGWIVDPLQALRCGPSAWWLKLWFECEAQSRPLMCLNTLSRAGVAVLAGCGAHGEAGPDWWMPAAGVRLQEIALAFAPCHCSVLPGLCQVKTCQLVCFLPRTEPLPLCLLSPL